LNPYLTVWFAGLSLAGMGLSAWVGHFGFRRLAVRYGAVGMAPPPGVLRALFRTLLTLWVYLVGAMLASLAWRVWPEVASMPTAVSAGLGILGLSAAVYCLARGY
jgi:hypothetical protein